MDISLKSTASSLITSVVVLQKMIKNSELIPSASSKKAIFVIDRYRLILEEGMKLSSVAMVLRGVNGVTRINKGLSDDPQISRNSIIIEKSFELLGLAIQLRQSTPELEDNS